MITKPLSIGAIVKSQITPQYIAKENMRETW